ncbi:right-handed parallel beta-helix repeat-containing protein [Sphingomonas sp. 3-13AW]|uniref:right-handed parallel beta-helix repeat-containing protein n=1 Tax=Sphingomonas sp. 3-13AW TaxID=3050450 RepID=UPI003BB80B98
MTLDRRTLLVMAGAGGVASPVPTPEAARPVSGDVLAGTAPLRLTDFMTAEMLNDVRNGTLRVDCAPALQAALNVASGRDRSSLQNGRKLLIPAGRYLLAQPVVMSWRDTQKIFDDGDMRRLTIEGDGQANTVLFYRGNATQPAIQIRGFKSGPGQGDGVSLRLSMQGFQLIRDLSTRHRGTGLMLNGAALIRFVDMEVSSFDVNIEMVDVLRVYMESVHINGGNIGLRARGGNFSNPNVYKILSCSISGNMTHGLHVIGGCNISLDSCAVEGNGHNSRRGSASILFEDGPSQGGAASHIDNCYFENNYVAADVVLDWKDKAPGTIKFTACTFQRTSAARAALHHIRLRSQTATMIAHVDSCAFKSFGDYTPAPERKAVQIQSPHVTVHWTANLFQNPEEAPPPVR